MEPATNEIIVSAPVIVRSKPRLIVWTLDINNYEPAVRALAEPLQRHWARKIGAEYRVIAERKFPDFPVVYEKLQLHELGLESDWTIFLDADALVHPDMFDPTNHLPKDTVAHNGKDMADLRWRFDEYFRRDGRFIGSCNWCAVASEWCLDLWKPLDKEICPKCGGSVECIACEGRPYELLKALQNIWPTLGEQQGGNFDRSHLIDDYTLSRNIARYGLKATTIVDICADIGFKGPNGQGWSPYFFHLYNIPVKDKIQRMLEHLAGPKDKGFWGLISAAEVQAYQRKWGIK